MNKLAALPCVVWDGLNTGLACPAGRGVSVIMANPGALTEISVSDKDFEKYIILSEYPAKRWAELHNQEIEVSILPRSAKRVIQDLLANPNHEYNLNHFTKEFIMATAAKTAAAKTPKAGAAAPDAKAANAAKAPAAAKTVAAKAPAKTAAAKPAAAPAKTAAKAPAAAEGRKGRPSGLDEAAKLKKGTVDFKEHVRAETVRFALVEAIVAGVGKPVGEVLGVAVNGGSHTVKSVDVRFAVENNYVAL